MEADNNRMWRRTDYDSNGSNDNDNSSSPWKN